MTWRCHSGKQWLLPKVFKPCKLMSWHFQMTLESQREMAAIALLSVHPRNSTLSTKKLLKCINQRCSWEWWPKDALETTRHSKLTDSYNLYSTNRNEGLLRTGERICQCSRQMETLWGLVLWLVSQFLSISQYWCCRYTGQLYSHLCPLTYSGSWMQKGTNGKH